MDCLSLLENSCGDKNLHFANATQLFTFNQIYSLPFWSTVIKMQHSVFVKKEFENRMYLFTNFYHSFETQRQLFCDEGDLHLCQSSAEFLLEPWLLMQLPWHPAVYYQWLIATLAEVLKAKKELVEFCWWPVAEKMFSVVRTLLTQVETLHRRIILGFDLIDWLTNYDQDPNSGYETNLHTVECILNMIVLPSLPAIEFLVGEKFNIMVRALKRMAWPSQGELTLEEELVATYCYSLETDFFFPAFCLSTDDLGNATHLFGEIGSLQDIKDQLDELTCHIEFVPTEILYDVVSLIIF
jgi:hypothetical protein